MDLDILELKRKLSIRRDNYIDSLNVLNRLFGINVDEYLMRYDNMKDNLIELGVQQKNIRLKMEELEKDFDGMNSNIFDYEDIDLIKEIDKMDGDNKSKLIDKIYREGFLSNSKVEELKNYIWNNRYRKVYSD